MANIKINDLQPAQIEFADLADIETSSIKGGILSLLTLSFGVGFAIGTAIYKAIEPKINK